MIEKMLMYFPEHINHQKLDDVYTPLHVAVANGHHELVELIVQQVRTGSTL